MKLKVYQKMDIVVQRQIYLRKLKDSKASGYKIFYQDETWFNANHTRQYVWQARGDDNIISDTIMKGRLDVPRGRGQRPIINDLGYEDGFLLKTDECFIGKKDSADYHREMNSHHFECWWENTVLDKLPDQSVGVIDNAKYHSRQTEDFKKPTTG